MWNVGSRVPESSTLGFRVLIVVFDSLEVVEARAPLVSPHYSKAMYNNFTHFFSKIVDVKEFSGRLCIAVL